MELKCLIIAAGQGSRLSRIGNPKPLVPLKEVPLIVRVMSVVKKAGIGQFVMVVGYMSDVIREKLGDGSAYGVQVEYIENPEWQKGNGLSVLKAKDKLSGNFILSMSDHLFDYKTLVDLQRQPINHDEIVLAVDCNTHPPGEFVDLSDVTKVHVDGVKIEQIGKDIRQYNAFDTGLFLCTPTLFGALEKSISENGDDSLSGGVRHLACEGKAKIFDIGTNFWIDVDDEIMFRKAEQYITAKDNVYAKVD